MASTKEPTREEPVKKESTGEDGQAGRLANPTVAPIVEQWHDGGFIVSVANGHRSFDQGVLVAGAKVYAGTVVGRITASGKYVTCVRTASDGSQNPAAILFATKDATLGDKPAVFVTRQAEVNGSELIWDASFTPAQILTSIPALTALGILVR